MNSLVLALAFACSFLLALGLTPIVAKFAHRFRLLDAPGERKVHHAATPRAGGVAIYVAFTLPFLVGIALHVLPGDLTALDGRIFAFVLGGTMVFALGVWDDARSLPAVPKLFGQIGAATLAYFGGIHMLNVSFPGFGVVSLDWLSLPATVLWFVLVINAINLIDGLDGLAAGITLFAALILLTLLDTGSRPLAAFGLAALAGATAGFLRYNFHPASIFLGDGGSYFLGFCLAALSIVGSVKSETTVAILIPIIALGVPVMDTIWSPVRRFVLGHRLFQPDADHIHHRLLKLGYTQSRAVLILYGITIAMGLVALSLVHARDDRAALLLVFVGAGAVIGIRKLGYFTFVRRERVVGWLGTVSDELGLRRNRRSFLECQLAIDQASSVPDLWNAVQGAARFLEIDTCTLKIEAIPGSCEAIEFRHVRDENENGNGNGHGNGNGNGNGHANGNGNGDHSNRTLSVSMPLLHDSGPLGLLTVEQHMPNGSVSPYLLRRIDQMRGTVVEALTRVRTQPTNGSNGHAGPSPADGRILYLSHYFPPEGNAPASRVHALSRQWVRSGQRVTVITCAPNVPDGKVYDGYRNAMYQREVIDGIDAVRVWTYLAANAGTARRIFNYLSYLLSTTVAVPFVPRPDVVIATSPQFFCGWAGVIASRLRRVPFILEIRDIWPESIATVGAMRNRRLLRLLEWLERRMYAAADHIVTVGEGYRDELCAKGVPAGKISVIPNGVDLELFVPRTADLDLRQRLAGSARLVCAYVGTVGMASGLDVVLRAGRLLRDRGRADITLLVVGDGAVRAELQQQAEREGLDNVVFTGRLDKDRIPPLLAAVDVSLVHLKKRQLFTTVLPSKIFEAAAMAKPIVLGVQGYAARLVEQADCGICIEPENEHELVAALERMADDPTRRQELGQQGQQFFLTHFDHRVLARRYLGLIQRMRTGSVVAPIAGPTPLPGESSRDTHPYEPSRVDDARHRLAREAAASRRRADASV